jgi:hypothetical protein
MKYEELSVIDKHRWLLALLGNPAFDYFMRRLDDGNKDIALFGTTPQERENARNHVIATKQLRDTIEEEARMLRATLPDQP